MSIESVGGGNVMEKDVTITSFFSSTHSHIFLALSFFFIRLSSFWASAIVMDNDVIIILRS